MDFSAMDDITIYLQNFKWTEEEIKFLVSKTLGYSIIFASVFIKLPQLIKIISAASSVGLSFSGVTLELLAVTFTTSYSYAKKYPFSSWGEAPFLQLETFLISFFILWYSNEKKKSLVFAIIFLSFSSLLLSGLLDMGVLYAFQTINLPLAVSGKLVQAYKNFQNGHTGQLSAIMVVLLTAGCVVRIFTTIHETGDLLIALTYVAAAAANFVLVAQVFYYWKQTNKALAKKSPKKKKN